MKNFQDEVTAALMMETGKGVSTATSTELYSAVSKAAMQRAVPAWRAEPSGKKACYFSAEFLVGRLVYSNLMNLGLTDELDELLSKNGIDLSVFEDIEDAALGNGGLGRLAACFLDSAATLGFTLNGYGIRYKFGLFKQYFEDGFQKETADDWQRFGDPWSLRKEDERVRVDFKGQSVWAVPYDTPVIGYGGSTINTLRLWQAEALSPFDFTLFNEQKYAQAVKERDSAEAISAVLYPNDDTNRGRRLRLKQQYFFSCASLQDLVRKYKVKNGSDFSRFPSEYAIQLNDTHPVVSIPELLRVLVEQEGLTFEQALPIVRKTFAYTNHTIMAEALEKWDTALFRSVLPEVYQYVKLLNLTLESELVTLGVKKEEIPRYAILADGKIHMARMAIFATHSVNGVAWLHTEILKNTALNEWYTLFPERFNNKTNGITQRRWLALANKELSAFLTKRIGGEWVTELSDLKKLEPLAEDASVLREFAEIKFAKKKQLADYIKKHEGITLNPSFLFDIQVKRLHEYKRQLLNALSILDIYFGLKDGRIKEFSPTAFIFGAKAAPGYFRAKGIIKFINEIAKMIDADPAVAGLLKVVFVSNYNVSYAEKLCPAADISEQISTAGTEASGTGNMKFMLNGAVTLGTYDGANVEIVGEAGEENEYIFGARIEELNKIEETYDPAMLYKAEPRIKKVVDTLIDGTCNDGGTGMFKDLYDCLLEKTYNRADNYYILYDFLPYCEAKLRANRDYADSTAFTRKCFLNMVHAGKFSSDRTIKEYAREIWDL